MAETPDNDQSPAAEPERKTPDAGLPATAETDEAQAHKGSDGGKARPRLLPALILVVLGAAVGGGALWYWQAQQQSALETRLQALEENRAESFDSGPLEQRIERLQAAADNREATLAQLEAALGARAETRLVESLAAQVAELEARLQALGGDAGERWKLLEAEFLLKLVNHRSALGQSGAETLRLARAADALLREIDSPELLAVRRALGAEISSLEQVEPVDREELYLQLARLQDAISDLSLAPRFEYRPDEAETPEPEAAEGVWNTVKASVRRALKALSNLVDVSHHGQPVEPLLPPEQAQYLRENLRLTLSQAQLAVLQAQPGVYRQNLEKARQWVETYLSDSPQRRDMLAQLQALQERTLVAEPVALGESLRLLQAQLAKREARQ